jgi:hypothetical protein
MIKAVFVVIVFNALTFLAFAFVTWEINPANWEAGMRGMCVIIGSMLGSLGALMAGEIK